jgi:predicted nucleic-acid-binding protein
LRAVDTNVLLRYLVADDQRQYRTSASVLESARKDDTPVFIPLIVLCEVVWVLTSRYKRPKAEVGKFVSMLLETKGIIVEDHDAAWFSLWQWLEGPADFSDYLIGNHSTSCGCRETLTFDRSLERTQGFRVLS